MWADNEADTDLLGFEFLVDSLVVALTEPRLLPLTCGLLGDWGSGKSSLMRITRAELEKPPISGDGGDHPESSEPERSSPYLCVSFSPWQFEGYDDIKVALMTAVLDALAELVTDRPDAADRVSLLRRSARRLIRFGRWLGRSGAAAAPAALPVVWQAVDPTVDPQVVDAAQGITTTIAGQVSAALEEPEQPGQSESAGQSGRDGDDEPVITAAQFRAALGAVLDDLPDLAAVVVFVDDLDRCLPDTVVDTFEAIRLFLQTDKTAYVIAANQAVVQHAIDSRYPEMVNDVGVGLGADYLEKMLQIKVTIPALAAPEAETYINLLLAELRLEPDQFRRVLDATSERRATGVLQVAFNLGICAEILEAQVPRDLERDLNWAASISPILGGGLRGNPRQLKRFLNSLLLRHRSAKRRHVDLDLPVLAKLMALEERDLAAFRRLFGWQMRAPGLIPELGIAETRIRGGAPTATDLGDSPATDDAGTGDTGDTGDTGRDVTADDDPGSGHPAADADERSVGGAVEGDHEAVDDWLEKPHVRDWVALSPPLSGTDLRPYFAYTRDHLALGAAFTRLPHHLQDLLTRVQIDVPAARMAVCDEIAGLLAPERGRLLKALLDDAVRQPGGPALVAAIDLTERAPDTLSDVCAALLTISPRLVPIPTATRGVRRLRGSGAQADAVLDHWVGSDAPGLAQAVRGLRQVKQRGSATS